MKVMMTNAKREHLSEVMEVTEAEKLELNRELKIRKSENRYIKCDENGKPNGASFFRTFEFPIKCAEARANGTAKRKTKRAVADDPTGTFFVCIQNPGEAGGYGIVEFDTKEKALEKVREGLGRRMLVITGRKLVINIDIA